VRYAPASVRQAPGTPTGVTASTPGADVVTRLEDLTEALARALTAAVA